MLGIEGSYICIICNLLDKQFSLPKPRELVNHVNELGISDDHKMVVYDKALDKALEEGLDTLNYTAELATEIQRDFLRKT